MQTHQAGMYEAEHTYLVENNCFKINPIFFGCPRIPFQAGVTFGEARGETPYP
jgi:hypothetical protein